MVPGPKLAAVRSLPTPALPLARPVCEAWASPFGRTAQPASHDGSFFARAASQIRTTATTPGATPRPRSTSRSSAVRSYAHLHCLLDLFRRPLARPPTSDTRCGLLPVLCAICDARRCAVDAPAPRLAAPPAASRPAQNPRITCSDSWASALLGLRR